MKDKVIINGKDNVGINLTAEGNIPAGHKFALKDISKGEYVIKYGEIIGKATSDIKKGEWVHTHNVKSHLDEKAEYVYDFHADTLPENKATFKGYKRKVGRAGIRNEIYIIPTVGCVNNVCKRLETLSQKYVAGSIDGIYALTHQFGCSQLGQDNENIKKLLCGIALNPNASFVLFVGLGCENNGLDGIKEYLKSYGRDNIEFFNCQDVKDEIEYGLNILKDFAEKAREFKREDVDFKELCIGLKCGGSDGYSGLTANPLVGKISDKAVSCGGSAILTEVPEMFGAEQLLMNKCKSREVFEKYRKMIEDFKAYYTDQGFPVYENPSPGNKKGGITTLEEKSLGCVEKAGSSEIVDVLGYGEIVKEQGVSALNAPGNDLIAATALAASGCQIVLFTTGRGTPFSTFVPTLKVSTNSALAQRKPQWIDFDAGTLVSQSEPMDTLLERLVAHVLDVVNGQPTRAEQSQIHGMAIWKDGVTL